jgi:hypothetical protein
MGWQTRGKREYYYKTARIDGKPRKIYLSHGPVGRTHAALDRLAAGRKAKIRAALLRVRRPFDEGDPLWTALFAWLRLLSESHLLLAGWYCRRGQWRRVRRRPRTRHSLLQLIPLGPDADLPTRLRALNKRANASASGAPEALRTFLDEHPEVWRTVGGLIQASITLWQSHVGSPTEEPNEAIAPETSQLERLLREALSIAKRHLAYAESLTSATDGSGLTLGVISMRLETAHNRVHMAQTLLTRVRSAGCRTNVPVEALHETVDAQGVKSA